MVADLLSHPNRQFFASKIIGIHFTFITKIPGDTLLTNMSAELPSTEQIFNETSRLVPLSFVTKDCYYTETAVVCCFGSEDTNGLKLENRRSHKYHVKSPKYLSANSHKIFLNITK